MANLKMAKACLTYSNLVLPRKSCEDDYLVSKNSDYPFLAYASQYWGDHVHDSETHPDYMDVLHDPVMRFFRPQRKEICVQAAWVTSRGGRNVWDVRRNVDKLHVCGWYGLSAALSEFAPEAGELDVLEPTYKQTPLMYACRRGHYEVARQLLQLGASQRFRSTMGKTALFEAILAQRSCDTTKASDYDRIIELLVSQIPRDLEINTVFEEEFKRTALMLTARSDRAKTIKGLLKHTGIDINMQDARGVTALGLAARDNCPKVVERLLEEEAETEILDYQAGRSALRFVAEYDHSGIVELLLQYGADPNTTDREGGTAMLRAANRGALASLQMLMEEQIDLTCVDHDGQSLLHGASFNGFPEIARLVMRATGKKSDVNVRDNNGMTPLHYASKAGRKMVLLLLVKEGADTALKDNFDRTPLMVARQYGKEDIVGILANAGNQADLDRMQLPVWAMSGKASKSTSLRL